MLDVIDERTILMRTEVKKSVRINTELVTRDDNGKVEVYRVYTCPAVDSELRTEHRGLLAYDIYLQTEQGKTFDDWRFVSKNKDDLQTFYSVMEFHFKAVNEFRKGKIPKLEKLSRK